MNTRFTNPESIVTGHAEHAEHVGCLFNLHRFCRTALHSHIVGFFRRRNVAGVKTIFLVSILTFLSLLDVSGAPVGTAFTYQGRLSVNGAPANGDYDLQFTLRDAPTAGNAVGSPIAAAPVTVSNGLFTVSLDFGAGVFNGTALWLDIGVRTNGSVAAYALLTPRQSLTATPFAVQAQNATTAASLSGTLSTSQIPNLDAAKITSGTLNAAQIPGLDASKIATGLLSDARLSANVPRLAGSNSFSGSNYFANSVGIGTTSPLASLDIQAGVSNITPGILAELVDDKNGWNDLDGYPLVAVSSNLLAAASTVSNTVTLATFDGYNVSRKFTFKNGQGGYTNLQYITSVVVSTNLLIIASTSAVTVVDVTDPSNPVLRALLRDGVGGFNEIANPASLALEGRLLAIAGSADSAVTLVDLSNPASPVLKSVIKNGQFGFTNIAGAYGVSMQGGLLAIAGYNYYSGITLVDVSNPAIPVLRSSFVYGQPGFGNFAFYLISGLQLDGNLLGIWNYYGYNALVDVSNPSAPVFSSDIPFSGYAMSFVNGLLWCGNYYGYLSAFDVSDAAHPTLKAALTAGRAGYNRLYPTSLTSVGNSLVIGSYSSVTILDTSVRSGISLETQGWVGIGTTNPLAPLHVVGNLLVENADRAEIKANKVELGYSQATGYGSSSIGYSSTASGDYSTAIGYSSTVSGSYSLAIGTSDLAKGDFSFAVGTSAKATNNGAFVWADSNGSDFSSTADNQFSVRASGGVRLVTSGAGLSVDGDTKLNDRNLLLRNDSNHGLGWYGTGKLFGGLNLDGPVLYGFTGGALGTIGAGQSAALSWNYNQQVGIGVTTNLAEVLEVSGQDTTVRIRNTNDLGGGFIGDTYATLQLGIYNPSGSAFGGIGAGTKRSLFGMDYNGKVGSLSSAYGPPTFRNVLDDGSGNMSMAGNFSFGSTGRQMINLFSTTYGIGTQTSTLYDRSAGGFAWFKGGIHSNTQNDPGSGGTLLMRLDTTGLYVNGTFVNASDRNAKTNFKDVSAIEMLDKVAALPLSTWNYKADPDSRHVGPMAQDFRALFGLGHDDKSIATVDADGVALAAIQGLNQKLETQVKTKQAQIDSLEKRLADLEKFVQSMAK